MARDLAATPLGGSQVPVPISHMTMIRSVTAADINEWLRMRHALWPDGSLAQHRQDIERYFAGDRREPAEVLFALSADTAPVGFAELSIRNIVDGCATDRVAYLEGWYVVPESRRKGIGGALIQAAEQWAIRQGCTEFGSDAEIDNEVSHAAHLRSGFTETGRVRTFRKKLDGSDEPDT
jgi:aminoglycoside 6'-N-acetyltransferase I